MRASIRRLCDIAGARMVEAKASASVRLVDLGAGAVHVDSGPEAGTRLAVPDDEERLLDLILAALPARAVRVGVVGAHGGAGATILAVSLAQVPVRAGVPVTLVDLDPVGGTIEVIVGVERDPGTRWADVRRQDGSLLPERLVTSLPAFEHVRLLGGDLRGGASEDDPVVARAVRAASQASDVVVVDLPRSALAPRGDGPGILGDLDHLVVVAAATLRGGAAASAAARRLDELGGGPRVSLVVRRRPGEDVLPDEIAEASGLELVCVARHLRSLDADIEHGVLPGARRRTIPRVAAEQVAGALGLET
ncbi:Septum site-determining protein MinD [Actinomycetales bacterium JB111]|nr:Septum site-determining protein MinD [Actinomycetales bacterium JB111]